MSNLSEEEIIKILKEIIQKNQQVIKEAYKNKDINTMQLVADIDNEAIAIQGLLDLYNKEKEINKVLEKQIEELESQLIDIHSNFCKFNWKESNGEQVHNQLKELYESIYRKWEKGEIEKTYISKDKIREIIDIYDTSNCEIVKLPNEKQMCCSDSAELVEYLRELLLEE